ncbi:MAG: transglutaminase domain-containing protein [Planctomycetes bacterium]|nr:transglutaminase domain-containing protein [Planctomycetota bacterium]
MMKNTFVFYAALVLGLFQSPVGFSFKVESKQSQVNNELLGFIKDHLGKSSYGNYMGGKKVGWDTDEIKLSKLNGVDVVSQISESYFKALFGGNKTEVSDRTEVLYSLDGKGDILFIKSVHIENGAKKTRELSFKKGGFTLVTTTQNRVDEKVVSKPKETLSMQMDLASWLKSKRAKGDVFNCFSTSVEEDDFNVPTRYIYKSKKNIQAQGGELSVHEVDQETHGALFYSLLENNGRLHYGRMGKIIEYRLESNDFAKKLDDNLVDLIQISAVTLDKKLGDPVKIKSLKLSFKSEDDFDVPQSHRQIIVKGKDNSLVMEIKRDFLLKTGQPLVPAEQKRLLTPSTSSPSDNPKVVALATRIIGDASTDFEKASRIVKWIFTNLEKTMAKNSDNALDVLDKKAGDCTEHTLLFVTLAKAVGIPSREVGGIAYMAGEKIPKMAWHAWAEFHDGKQWLTADPTWNQTLVDGTHIKFSEGSTDLKWLNILGGLNLQVIDFQKD